MITAQEMSEFRNAAGLSQAEMASILNDILDMHYGSNTISRWEKERTSIPGYVSDTIEALRDGGMTAPPPTINGTPQAEMYPPTEAPFRKPDSAPKRPAGVSILPTADATPVLQQAAVEMWRGIGGMLELLGVTLGAPKVITDANNMKISLLEMDGRIVAAHAEPLGHAWARLAEQNAWVARILKSMTTGGAWVEVASATSATFLDVYRNHANYATWAREQTEPVPIDDSAAAESGASV
jgi:transcriptional regulator with XRE-family HTH domain